MSGLAPEMHFIKKTRGITNRCLNIARGTTDPEIDSVTWIKLATEWPFAIVANLTTRGRHLH